MPSYVPASRFSSQSGAQGQQPKAATPLLVHFDVNKTVIQSDSIQMKGIEDGIREGIAELFWGYAQMEDGKLKWEWARTKPSCYPNVEEVDDQSKILMNYFEYCRKVVEDKANRKEIIKTFKLVGQDAKVEMEKLLQVTMKKMQLPPDIKYTKDAEEAGLRGTTVGIFPTLFHFVAALQRSKRHFAILFRSFGADHEKIKLEWNSFCEMRHPVYKNLIEGVGPLDGTRPGVPDRRVQHIHTIYRDAEGPVLILETFTNGPNGNSWDAWAKTKPKPKEDTRDGRSYSRNVLQAKTVDGLDEISAWMKTHCDNQQTAALKDDWAWWQWHGEQSHAGKLLTLFGEPGEYEHLFFDDNIEIADTRIVDCRDADGKPIESEAALNKICTKVNPVEALLDDGYFLRKLQLCHGEHLDVGASLMDFQKQLAELEDNKGGLLKKVKALTMQLKTLTDENRRMKLLHRLNVRSEGHLRELLAKDHDLEIFGQNGFGSISDLYSELEQGNCWLEQDEHGKLIRSFEMVFIEVQFDAGSGGGSSGGGLILVESYEQSSHGRVQSRNFLPGVRKSLKESTFQTALDRWLDSGLGVRLTDCINSDVLPVYTPEAPSQITLATQAYPIQCKIQQSEIKFVISNKAQMTHSEVLSKIGLPAGKHFTKVDKEEGSVQSVTRFFRWDKVATWEASRAGTQTQKGQEVDIQQVCDKLFRGHPRQEVYENLLLQMFEVFTATKLCGGFSGSVVIRVQPFDERGIPIEACIVKLDEGKAIREEVENSNAVFQALPDRAARIIGESAYAWKGSEEFGAMRLELAGACWNVPELAQGSANLLVTFKDLLLYESEQAMGTVAMQGDIRPFGNVNSVLAETFGPGGVVASLRKGGAGMRRAIGIPLPTTGKGAFHTLKGKESDYNPYTAKEKYPPEPAMRRLYKQCFGEEWPDLGRPGGTDGIVGRIKVQLQELAKKSVEMQDLCPLIALAHGDLNAANIMIDALDAVWLIDFATSVQLPLFTDLSKFEMACLFEYATIPITPKMLLEFASSERTAWAGFNVGDWLRIKKDIAELLMHKLADVGLNRLAGVTEEQLHQMIDECVNKSGHEEHKQREARRALKARLTHDENEMLAAFSYCKKISNTLLQGDYIFDTLNIVNIPQPDAVGHKGAASLKFFMEIAKTIRRFQLDDVKACLRSFAPDLQGIQVVEGLSLQLWLPILRESYRLIGYGDVPPQQKIWSIYHCKLVAENVLRTLEFLNGCNMNFNELPYMARLKNDLANTQSSSTLTRCDFFPQRKGFKEIDSRWIYNHKDVFPPADLRADKVVHKVHAHCPVYKKEPGLFAPIFQVVTEDNLPIQLLFERDPVGDLTLYFNTEELTDDALTYCPEEAPLFDPALGNIAGAVRVDSTGQPTMVVLSSRLLFVTNALVKVCWDKIYRARCSDGEGLIGNGFVLSEWSTLFSKSGTADTPKKLADHHSTWAQPRSVISDAMGSIPSECSKFLTVPAIARRAGTTESLEGAFSLNLVLGNPALCYPAGTKLCIDTSAVVQQRSLSSEVVVLCLQDSGLYHVADVTNPGPENERDFGPSYGNHIYLTECKYKLGDKIIFNKHGNSWVDCDVAKSSQAGSKHLHALNCTLPSMPAILDDKDAAQEKEIILRHVNVFNSGPSWMPASVYEEEVNNMRKFMRARHSSIIDALSGTRWGVKSCAVPTLREAGKDRPEGSRQLAISRKGSTLDTTASDRSSAPDKNQGWSLITSALDKYDRAEEHCSPNAFLVFGAPGSGKSCLVCRLIMDCLESKQNLVPVLLTVSDLVKRSEHDADIHGSAVSEWFDKYLRLTFGQDSPRYKMVRQAMAMHRVVFLFEGLEDGGALTPVIEKFVKDLVMDRHWVVVTSRPLLTGTEMEGRDEYICTLELQNLTDEQQRSIAHARLGPDGLTSFDQFFNNLRQSHSSTSTEEGVFGNPMMLSMLLCYLSMKQQEKDERRSSLSEDVEDNVTITAVYRVAVDVMLKRVQSKQQADRHQRTQKVEECMRIVEKMAMKMQVKKGTSIEASEFEKDLEPELRATWESLLSAVQADNAVFLRSSNDGNKSELQFLVRGFQVFFAASEIANDGSEGKHLPGLETLLTEPSWAQMLGMLAEAWPHRYVRLIVNMLEKFQPNNGNTFLHLAARTGHRPVFQLLKLFSEAHQGTLFTPNSEGMWPLHVAAKEGNLQICRLLIDHQACVDAEDKGERLPMHVALQCKHFKTAKFLLEKYLEKRDDGVTEKRRSALSTQTPAIALASRILDESSPLSEGEFRKAVEETFVELRFFDENDPESRKSRKVAVGSLLCMYWICCGQYEQFVRAQPEPDRLTRETWEKIMDWAKNQVQITKSNSTLGALLVFVAISLLGKIKNLQEIFAPHVDEHNEALCSVLHNYPSLISSFCKLDVSLQQMILASLKSSEFNFGQFLQAENLPASLVIVKQILGEQEGASASILNFFLFRNFVSMCGLFSWRTMEGSAFMTDPIARGYVQGLGVLQHLTRESSAEVYNRFLAERAKVQGLPFNAEDGASRALVRLACLCRAQDDKTGRKVAEAWQGLEPAERAELIDFLNANGIDRKGFILYTVPNMMEWAGLNNKNVGLLRAMKLMLKVFRMAAQEFSNSEEMVVTIMLKDLVDFSRKCKDPEVLDFVKFEVVKTAGPKQDCQGNLKLSPWQLMRDQEVLDKIKSAGTDLVTETMEHNMQERAFHQKLESGVFPEMNFFTWVSDGDQEARKALKQTQGALLAIYWTASEQSEAFARGQASDAKLTDKSWQLVMEMYDSVTGNVLDVVYVVCVVHALGKIPKFQEQLAPKSIGHRQVLAHVMETCPEVLPSYMRLSPPFRELAKFCATVDFSFEQYMTAEALPANLSTLKDTFQKARNNEHGDHFLQVFLLTSFAILSGSLGYESLEGSTYMTENMFTKFRLCVDTIKRLYENPGPGSELTAYTQMLSDSAQNIGLPWDAKKPEVVAGVRLACLAQVTNPLDAFDTSKSVRDSFEDSGAKDVSSLFVKFLTADGIGEKPGFILSGCPAFIKTSGQNTKVGLKTCVQILLKVYIAAAQEFVGSTQPIITIQLGKLTACAADFTGSGAFQDLPFEMHRCNDAEALVIPKVWIPVSDKAVLNGMRETGWELASELLQHKVSEENFRTRLGRTFPELSYFSAKAAPQRDQTIGALLSIFWLLSNNYDAFIRSQPQADQLTKKSWAWMQEWIVDSVKLSTKEAVDAALVFMAIHALGKIPEFREELAPNYSTHMHDLALAHILQNHPQVVPSFSRLSDNYRRLIVDSLGVDFQFAQFLLAENTPANLVLIQERLRPHGDDGFAFFCFRIFVQICGKHGPRSLKGSLFMTESQFKRFRPGLVVLQRITTVGAIQTYQNFLLHRSSAAMARFASPEHQALARLLCLGCAFTPEDGAGISLAFDELQADERIILTRLMNADEHPDYVLSGASDLLLNARMNKAVSMTDALRMLLAVQRKVMEAFDDQPPSKVVIHLQEVAAWAKRAGPGVDEFLSASLAVRAEGHAVFTVSVAPASAEIMSPNSERTTAAADRLAFGPTNGHVLSKISDKMPVAQTKAGVTKESSIPQLLLQPSARTPPAPEQVSILSAKEPSVPQLFLQPSTPTPPAPGQVSPAPAPEAVSSIRRGAPPPQVSVSRTPVLSTSSTRSIEQSVPTVTTPTVPAFTVTEVVSSARAPMNSYPSGSAPQVLSARSVGPVLAAPTVAVQTARPTTPVNRSPRLAVPTVTPPQPATIQPATLQAAVAALNRQNSFSTASIASMPALSIPASIPSVFSLPQTTPPMPARIQRSARERPDEPPERNRVVPPPVSQTVPPPTAPARTPSHPSGFFGPSRMRSPGASLVTPMFVPTVDTQVEVVGPSSPQAPLPPSILLPTPSVVLSPERYTPPVRSPLVASTTPGVPTVAPLSARVLTRGPTCSSMPSLNQSSVTDLTFPPLLTTRLSSGPPGSASPRTQFGRAGGYPLPLRPQQ